MQRLQQQLRVVPERIQVDNGKEFISKALDRWTYDQQITLVFSRQILRTWNRLMAAHAVGA